jgi:hypothetical protein
MTFFHRLLFLIACLPVAVHAQSHGYVFFGPGGVTSGGHTDGVMCTGIGGEFISGIGVGGGVEVGYNAPWGALQNGIGTASANGAFHFKPSARIVPFVTGGYTLFFRNGHANGFNFGGGVNWWFATRFGLKADIRDQVGVGDFSGVHFWGFRAGLTLR